MNVMDTVALRQMKSQKRRTVITILGVIVAVAMIAAVSSFGASFMGMFQQVVIASDGEWHAKITNTSAADREMLRAQPQVRDVFVMGRHGNWALHEKKGVYSGEKRCADYPGPGEGRFPAARRYSGNRRG